MDNIQFWLYVIILVIYFISKLRKKPQEDSEPENLPEESGRGFDQEQPARPVKPMTFEDLLREISEAKNSPPITTSSPSTEAEYPQYEDYDDDIKPEEETLERPVFNDDQTTKIYEEAKSMAFHRPSLEETVKLEQVDTSYKRFRGFEKEKELSLAAQYAKDLKNPKDIKKALVLSEVLNRRHF